MFVFFFNDTATTEIYTLSLHDALPISLARNYLRDAAFDMHQAAERLYHCTLLVLTLYAPKLHDVEKLRNMCEKRSEEHTSELQSRQYLVCRLLLEKK